MFEALIVVLLPIAIGAVAGTYEFFRRRAEEPLDNGGWVYFMAASEGPVKIGMSKRDPAKDRLEGIRTMSPFPVRVIYKMEVDDRFEAEKVLHEDLKAHRMHGEWFDRDAALYTIDHLKGAV